MAKIHHLQSGTDNIYTVYLTSAEFTGNQGVAINQEIFDDWWTNFVTGGLHKM